jgi:hypothetical protein
MESVRTSPNSERVEYQAVIIFNSFGIVAKHSNFSIDFIYGYSYLILSELWVGYFLFAPLLVTIHILKKIKCV